MVIKVFISSNISEFSEERKYLYEELKKDPFFNKTVELFVFEENSARSIPSSEVFINAVEESDIFIGLIGQNYGNIYKNGVSATEFEYDVYTSKKYDDYFFIKDCSSRDEKSTAFLDRIRPFNKFNWFTTKEELLDGVKTVLEEYIENKLKHKEFDEELLLDSSIDDVDSEAIRLYKEALEDNKIKELFEVRQLDKILEYIGAGEINYKGVFHLNKAGALFFAKDITKFNIEHDIKMVRFNGNEPVNIIDKLFTHKSFFILLKEFDNFFDRNTRLGGIVKGMERISIPEYPIEAVREAFINAIAHRDYTLTGGCITFYIYDDRIEIISPGNLQFPLTVETLGIDIVPLHRNKLICNIFEKTKYMEHVGTGITRMRSEMRKCNLPEPEFEDGFYFKVILRGPNGRLILPTNATVDDFEEYDLNSRQADALVKMINEDVSFTYDSYISDYDISKSTAKRDLSGLVEKKLIRKRNIKKTSYFFV